MVFTPQNFVDNSSPAIAAAWLNQVDQLLKAPPTAAGNILLYGAVSGSDASSAITSAAAANSLVVIPAGTWPIAAVPTIPANVQIQCLPGAVFSGAGAGALGFSTSYTVGAQFTDFSPVAPAGGAGEITGYNYFRNAINTGGSPGTVANALRIQTNVAAGVTNFEWGFLSILLNSAIGGQNVAIYGQGNKETSNTGPTWAGVFEARDVSGAANPVTGLIGLEIDVRASGADNNFNRVGLDLVLTRYPYNSGPAAVISYGYRVGSFGDSGVTVEAGYTVSNTNVGFAFDCANSTVLAGAMRMPAGASILFDSVGVNQLLYDSVGLAYHVSGNLACRVNQNGVLNLGTGAYSLASAITSQVVVPVAAGIVQASHSAQDTLAGTTLCSGFATNNSILTGTAVINYRGFEAKPLILQAGASVSNYNAFYVGAVTPGSTLNVGFNGNLPAGANNYNILCTSAAQNQLGGPLGVNGNVAPVQSTGWGTPTGGSVANNFPGATATLAQTSATVAQLISVLKSIGFLAT
jgi:hypothetical protein